MNHFQDGRIELRGIIRLATVNVYKNAFNSDVDIIRICNKCTVKDVVHNLNWKHTIVYVNGFIQDENYEIKDNDVISVREFPRGTVIPAIIISALVIAPAIYGIGESFGWWTAIGNWFKNKFKNWLGLDGDVASNEQEQLTTYPTVSGSKNQLALGKTIPLILGKTYFTPYIIGKPYTTIGGEDGKEVYYHCLYLIGYNDIKVKDISLGIYPICSNDGVTKGVLPSKNYAPEQSVIQEIENGELALNYETTTAHYNPKEYNMKLELQQGANEVSLYDQKVVQTDFNTELLHPHGEKALDVYAFSSKYPQKIEVEIQFNGLIGYDNEGKKQNRTVEIGLQMSIDGGSTWTEFGAFTGCNSSRVENGETISTFTRQKNETMRFVATREFTYKEIQLFNNGNGIKNNVVELRIRRKTEKSTETNIADDVALMSVRTWCYDNKLSQKNKRLVKQVPMEEKYRNITARLGFVCKAGDEIQGQMESLNCICTSKARIWDGEKWSKTTYPTDNPASLSLLALTGKHRSQYAYLIDDSGEVPTSKKINLNNFGKCYEVCDVPTQYGTEILPRFSCCGAILKKTKTVDIVNQILSCCRGFLTIPSKQYEIVMDEPREQAVMLLNAQNILEQNNTKSFDDIPDGLQIKYISAINGYKEDSFICKPNDCTIPESEMKLQPMELPYITHPFRAKALGLYTLACMKLRPETWEIKLGQDGNLIEVGNLVNIQNDTLSVGIGFGGEVTKLIYDNPESPTKILKIKTDASFPVTDCTKDYGIVIQQSDGINEPIVIKRKVVFEENGSYDTFTLDSPISLDETRLPSLGDILTFGFLDSECVSALCMGKKDNNNGTFTLTFVPYQEGVYTADSGIIDDFDSKVTPPQVSGSAPIQKKPVSLDQLNDAIYNVATGGDKSVPADISEVFANARKDEIIVSFVTNENGLNNSAIGYKCQIKKGSDSEWTDFDIINDSYIFDRSIDGYPEYNILNTWKIRAKAINVYGKESANWKETSVSTTGYGTWNVTKPEVNTRVSDRTITLMISESPRGDTREVYGDVKYKVQIQKSEVDTEWYKPNESANPYESEDNYKDLDSTVDYVVSGNVYVQTLPLTGQTSNDIHDTSYRFRVVAFNEKNEDSIERIVEETALCTSIKDIVQANETDKERYIRNLTSLCSAFGFISEGGSQEDLAKLLNYWTLNDGILDGKKDSSGNNIKMKGAFRIGGKDQFLICRPIKKIVNGVEVIDYELELKVGNFTLTSTTTSFNTNLYIYDEALPTRKRLKVTSTGLVLETSNDDKDPYAEDKEWIETAVIVADSNGNLTITNDWHDESLPTEKIIVEEGTIIYHLEDNTQDNFGGNTAMFNFKPNGGNNGFVNSSLIEEAFKAYKGTISKEMEAEYILLFNNSNKIRIGNDLIDTESLSIDSTCEELNTILGTTAFRWEM